MLCIRTDTRVKPKHSLPPHTIVEFGKGCILACTVRPQHRSKYAKNGFTTCRRWSSTSTSHLIHRTCLFKRLKSGPVVHNTVVKIA